MTSKLRDLFTALQDQLMASLVTSRSVLDHAPSKGASTEIDWKGWLNDHLPSRYQAQSAFVIDSEGECSDQIDIVIYDHQYTPVFYNKNDQRFIPAESVYAVFEVKQELNKGYLEYAGAKAASVRKLKRTSWQITHAGGVYKEPKAPGHILAGILCTNSGWNPPYGSAFEECILEISGEEHIDIGCVIASGAFTVDNHDPANVITTISSTEDALSFFLMHLLKLLQGIGTVTAIDYDEYSKSLFE
jgi:hypothetical protein